MAPPHVWECLRGCSRIRRDIRRVAPAKSDVGSPLSPWGGSEVLSPVLGLDFPRVCPDADVAGWTGRCCGLSTQGWYLRCWLRAWWHPGWFAAEITGQSSPFRGDRFDSIGPADVGLLCP